MLLNILNLFISVITNTFNSFSHNNFLSQSANILAAQSHLKNKLTYTLEHYAIFFSFGLIVFSFLIVVFLTYIKEKKKHRY